MKIKPLILATALALSGFTATSSYAEDFNQIIDLGSPSTVGGYSKHFGVTHLVAGNFTDTFTFTPAFTGWVQGVLSTISFNHYDNIEFLSATINGHNFAFEPGSLPGTNIELGGSQLVGLTGPIIIKVFGVASPLLAAGSDISAAYSGTLTATIAAIPEPGTYAMMLAGLGLVGFMARRRKQTESKETLPQLSAC